MTARERLAIDAVVLAAILAAANPATTGIGLHAWIGLTLVVPALLHLIVNWEWVVHSVTAFLGKLRLTSRVNLLVDAGLFVSLVGVTVSGVLVMPGMARLLGVPASGIWHVVHLTTSNLTLALTLAHLVLHAQWIVDAVRKLAFPRPARYASAPTMPSYPTYSATPTGER